MPVTSPKPSAATPAPLPKPGNAKPESSLPEHSEPMPEKLFSTNRLEAFSDGVLAVIITIMVLELKIPRENGLPGLISIAPTLFIYLLSFTLTGIYWINHHHLISRIERADPRVLYANLGFLFCASLLPFFTSNVIEKDADSFSVALYAASMIGTAIAFLFVRLAVARLLRRESFSKRTSPPSANTMPVSCSISSPSRWRTFIHGSRSLPLRWSPSCGLCLPPAPHLATTASSSEVCLNT